MRAAFGISVSGIFGTSAKPKMGRIPTSAIVTSMANRKTVRDWAVMNFKGCTMRPVQLAAILENSIAIFNFCALPYPTLIGCAWRAMLPKAISERGKARGVMTRTKTKRLTFDIAINAPRKSGKGGELAAATFAGFF